MGGVRMAEKNRESDGGRQRGIEQEERKRVSETERDRRGKSVNVCI